MMFRCMALSTVIFVGESKNWLKDLVDKAKLLKVGSGLESSTDIGPLITKEAKKRVETLIQEGIKDGAKCLLDGK